MRGAFVTVVVVVVVVVIVVVVVVVVVGNGGGGGRSFLPLAGAKPAVSKEEARVRVWEAA